MMGERQGGRGGMWVRDIQILICEAWVLCLGQGSAASHWNKEGFAVRMAEES